MNDADRRARSLRITNEGVATLNRVQPSVEAAQHVLLSGLSDSEAERFMRLLRKAIDALNERSRAPLRPGSSEGSGEGGQAGKQAGVLGSRL